MRPADLDYTPLTRHVAWRARLRAVGSDARLVIGATIGALMVLFSAGVLFLLVVIGRAADGGGIAVLVVVLLMGLYVLYDAVGQAASPSALADFAVANGLESLVAVTPTGYAAPVFADGRATISQGVCTRQAPLVEVGDRFTTSALGAASQGGAAPELYLRVRLRGRPTRRPEELDFLPPDLHDALTELAGPFTLHLSRGELTLLGSRPLDPLTEGRLRAALELTARLAERADPTWAATSSTPSLVKTESPSRPRRALVVVLGTLAVVVVVPLLIAVVMSSLEDRLRGNEGAATLVVSLLVVVVLLVVGGLVRLATSPRRRRDGD